MAEKWPEILNDSWASSLEQLAELGPFPQNISIWKLQPKFLPQKY